MKFVPSYCVADGGKYYPFTAKDECTRWTYREMYDEHSSVSAKDFLEKLVRNAPFAIRMVQTDNGAEFTNVLLVTKSKHKTLFEEALIGTRIVYPRICIATPRHSHNGKVERQYRTDEMRFYKHMQMYSLEDGRRQLAVYQRQSTNHIMTCLGMKPPRRCLVCTGASCKQTRPSGAQSQILCKLRMRREQSRIQCARQRIYPTAACVQYNAGGDGCQGQRQGRRSLERRAAARRPLTSGPGGVIRACVRQSRRTAVRESGSSPAAVPSTFS